MKCDNGSNSFHKDEGTCMRRNWYTTEWENEREDLSFMGMKLMMVEVEEKIKRQRSSQRFLSGRTPFTSHPPTKALVHQNLFQDITHLHLEGEHHGYKNYRNGYRGVLMGWGGNSLNRNIQNLFIWFQIAPLLYVLPYNKSAILNKQHNEKFSILKLLYSRLYDFSYLNDSAILRGLGFQAHVSWPVFLSFGLHT